MTTGITIRRRDGSVLFHSATATTTAQAVNELVAEARRNLRSADLRYADLYSADLRSADLRSAKNVPHVLTVGPLDGWLITLTNTLDGWRFTAGCRYLTEGEARAHWADASGWSPDSAPEHGARMLAGVDALISMARALGWPEKLVGEAEAVVA